MSLNFLKGNLVLFDKQSIRRDAEAEVNSKNLQKLQAPKTLSFDEIQENIHELEVHQVELEMQNEELLSIQEELRRTEQRYFDLYELAPLGYCTLNEDGLIEELNLTFSNQLKTTKSKLLQVAFSQFIFPEDQDIYYFFSKKFFVIDELHECELRMIKEDKTLFWVLLSAILETSSSKKPLVRLVIHDISERKKIQEELKEKEEMMLMQSKQAAMGEMIAMIAHQWKQPLSVISLSITNLIVRIGLGKEITTGEFTKHAEVVTTQIHQLSETVDDFRNFFTQDQSSQEIKIEEALYSTMSILDGSLISNKISLNIKDNSTHYLSVNKSSLVQVLLNIIGNAIDALSQKKIPKGKIDINIDENDKEIIISIHDNAGGIPESIIQQIDQPYFSTKESKVGTGYGLYISRMIMDKHLFGTLSWHNEAEGACFVITLNKKEENFGK